MAGETAAAEVAGPAAVNTGDQQFYLLLDDHGARASQFQKNISNTELVIKTAFEAIDLRDNKDDLVMLDGAIVDFHLETPQRPDYPYLRYPCTDRDCPALGDRDDLTDQDVEDAQAQHDWHATAGIPEVDVTTGLGAMLYIKQHAPDVALFGLCELNAEHSLLYLNAAHLWLGASAINAEYPPDLIRTALTSGLPESDLPINQQLAAARGPFKDLTNSLDHLRRPAESIDWLAHYRHCPRQNTLAEFKRLLGLATLEYDIYKSVVCRWQGALSRMLEAFNVDVSNWPDLRNVTSARYWDDNNPVLDFLRNGDYHTFFTAPDVRAALAYYRANTRREAAEDPRAGF